MAEPAGDSIIHWRTCRCWRGVILFTDSLRLHIRILLFRKGEGIYLQGLKYPLENAALTNTCPVGTSNEFNGKKSRIAVKSGTLMVVFPKEAKEKMIC